MDLNLMKSPINRKYIEAEFKPWFIFGVNKETKLVDISDSESDVFTKVPLKLAIKIIAIRNEFIDKICDALGN